MDRLRWTLLKAWHRWRWPRRLAAVGWLGFFFTVVLLDLTTWSAAADNCSVYTDCFGQSEAASEAALGLTFLAALSLTLDFIPIIGDAKGLIEMATGRDLLTGEELEPWERALGLIGLVPGGDLFRLAKVGGNLAGAGGSAARNADFFIDVGSGAAEGFGRNADNFSGVGRHGDSVPSRDPFGLNDAPAFTDPPKPTGPPKPTDRPNPKPPEPHKPPDEVDPGPKTRQPAPSTDGGSSQGGGRGKDGDGSNGRGGDGDGGDGQGRGGDENGQGKGEPEPSKRNELNQRRREILESYGIDPGKLGGEFTNEFTAKIDDAYRNPTSTDGIGSRGELESIRDAQRRGQTVEIVAVSKDKGVQTADLKIDGEYVEVKSRAKLFDNKRSFENFFEKIAKEAGKKFSETGTRGVVELRVLDRAQDTFELGKADAAIKKTFSSGKMQNVDRLTTYDQQGNILTEWIQRDGIWRKSS